MHQVVALIPNSADARARAVRDLAEFGPRYISEPVDLVSLDARGPRRSIWWAARSAFPRPGERYTQWTATCGDPPSRFGSAASGWWAAFTLEQDGTVAASTDPLGVGPCFFTEGPYGVAVGSRQGLVRVAAGLPLGSRGLDPLAAAQLLGGGGPPFCSAWRGLRRLRAGESLTVDRHGQIDVKSRTTLPRLPATPAPDAGAFALDVVASAVRHCLGEQEEATLALTGGRDSRLVLAVLAAERLLDQVRCVTFGPPGSPDRELAAQAAAAVGAEHSAAPFDLATADDAAIWESTHRTAWHEELSGPPYNPLWPSQLSPLVLTGSATEWLRGPPGAPEAPNDPADILEHLRRLEGPSDPLRLLSADVRVGLDDALADWVERELEHGIPASEVHVHFLHALNTERWLSGHLCGHAHPRTVAPLLSAEIARAFSAAGYEGWVSGDLQSRLIASVAPELLRVPLLGQPWPRAITSLHSVPDAVARPPMQMLRGWHAGFIARQRERILQLASDAMNGPLGDICDVERLEDLLAASTPDATHEIVALFGLIGVALADQEPPALPLRAGPHPMPVAQAADQQLEHRLTASLRRGPYAATAPALVADRALGRSRGDQVAVPLPAATAVQRLRLEIATPGARVFLAGAEITGGPVAHRLGLVARRETFDALDLGPHRARLHARETPAPVRLDLHAPIDADDVVRTVRLTLECDRETAFRLYWDTGAGFSHAASRRFRRSASRGPAAGRYIDLLRDSLVGVTSRTPHSAKRLRGGGVEIVALEEPALRADGRDWPADADTMIGLRRMESLGLCVTQALRDGVPGDLLEAGVWRGGAAVFMRGILAAHGVSDRTVWVCDSFEGLPPPRPDKYPADAGDRHHTYEYLAVSEQDVRGTFKRYGLDDARVAFVKGWFADTLPSLAAERLAVARIDGDMYESTFVALKHLYPKISPGGFVIVDDYGAIPACRLAVDEFRAEHGIKARLQVVDWTGVLWQKPGGVA